MMNVLHIDTEKSWRGGQAQVFEILRYQSAIPGMKVALIARRGEALAKRVAKELPDVLVVENAANKGLPRFLNEILTIRSAIKSLHPEIVHVHSSKAHSYILLALKSLVGVSPKIMVHRRVDYKPNNSLFSRWKYLNDKISHYICVSNFVRNILEAYGVSANKITTVYSSLSHERFRDFVDFDETKKNALLMAEGVDPTKFVFVCPAALTEQKGHRYLLEAFSILQKNLSDTSHGKMILVLCGDGGLKNSLEQQCVELGLKNYVKFLGHRNDVYYWMQCADAVVMASVDEGLGTSILEAGYYKKPVVATRVGGISEIITNEELGYLVSPRDAKALCDAMKSCMKDAGHGKNKGLNLSDRVLQEFMSESMNKKIMVIYQNAKSN